MKGKKRSSPPQHQERQPGIQSYMEPQPVDERQHYITAGRLQGKIALITGADSGIGRAVAILYAKEGADIAAVYFNEHQDARETEHQVKEEKRKCLLISGDIADEAFCEMAVRKTADAFGGINILVNNAGVQFPQKDIAEINAEQLQRTFATNIFSMFYLTKAALKYLRQKDIIINTTSVTAYQGHPMLIDYASSKGAIVAFTRSLAMSLVKKGIRVNAVAPGPVWTPLTTIFPEEKIASFGESTPMERPGQPVEIAPCFLFLATEDSSYMTGQVLHPNGGRIVNG